MASQVQIQAQPHVPVDKDFWVGFYLNRDSRACRSFERIEFHLKDRQSRIRLCEKFIDQVTAPVAMGSSLGGLLAVILVMLDFFPGTSPPAIVATGLLGGAAIGASTVIKNVIEIDESSSEYLEWWGKRIQKGSPDVIAGFVKQENLEESLCPITADWIRGPVKAPDGRTYENMFITQWLEKKEKEYPAAALAKMSEEEKAAIFSPIRKRYFTRDDLKFDFDYHGKLKQKIEQVFKGKADAKDEVKEGLKLYVRDVLHVQKQVFKFLSKNLETQFQENQITTATYLSKLTEMSEKVITFKSLEQGELVN